MRKYTDKEAKKLTKDMTPAEEAAFNDGRIFGLQEAREIMRE